MRRAFAPTAVLAAVTVTALASPAAPQLDDVLRRFDAVQQSIQTLSAEFRETTESPLLADPIVGSGRVYLTKPDSVRWDYSVPEPMRFVISADEYTGYFPDRKQAERRDVHRWSEQLFRFLGLGQTSAELGQFYDIRLGEPDGQGTYLLVLDPQKKRVRKRMDSVRLWIDATSYLPVRLEYLANNGNRRRIEFHELQVNPQIAASLYQMQLPPDVEVTKGFSALSGFSGARN